MGSVGELVWDLAACHIAANLSHELSEKEEKIVELRHALTALDQDHDLLLGEANQKDEAIATLHTRLERKGAELSELESRVLQLRTDLGHVEDSRKERELEASHTHSELDSTRSELLATRQQVDALTQQISELRNDLNTMTQVRGRGGGGCWLFEL